MKKIFSRLLLLTLAIVISLSAVGCSLFENIGNIGTGGKIPGYEQTLPDSAQMSEKVQFGTQEGTEREYSKVKAVNKVARSVVGILYPYTDSTGAVQYGGGSGVIVDISTINESTEQANETENEFYIMTCAHVLDFTGSFSVYLPDRNGRNFSDKDYDESFVFDGVMGSEIYTNNAVTLVGADKEADIAVLKLDITGNLGGVTADDVTECKIAPEDYSLSLGEDVFAIGNPSGILPMTVSNGIVSYLDRRVFIGSSYMTLVQIDVQTNHGSSGGALFNYYGELVGITNGGSEVYDGINYAIPFKNVYSENDMGFVNIAKQLIATKTATNYGYVSGRWNMGIVTSNGKHPETNETCFMITEVVAGTNAAKSGLLKDDIITGVMYTIGTEQHNVAISSNAEFLRVFAEIKEEYTLGESFVLKIERNGSNGYEEQTITFNITEQFIFCNTGN